MVVVVEAVVAVDAVAVAVQPAINATGLDILLANALKGTVATNVMAQATLLVIARVTRKKEEEDTIVEIAVVTEEETVEETVVVVVDKLATRAESLVTFQETVPLEAPEEVDVVAVAAAVVEETVTTAGSLVILAASAKMNVNRTCLFIQLRYHVIF